MWEELKKFVDSRDKKGIKRVLERLEKEIMYSFGKGEVPDDCLDLIEGIYTDDVCRSFDMLGSAVLSFGTDPELLSKRQQERLRLIFELNVTEGLSGYLVDVAVDCYSRIFSVEQCFAFYEKIIERNVDGGREFVWMGLKILLSEKKASESEVSSFCRKKSI